MRVLAQNLLEPLVCGSTPVVLRSKEDIGILGHKYNVTVLVVTMVVVATTTTTHWHGVIVTLLRLLLLIPIPIRMVR